MLYSEWKQICGLVNFFKQLCASCYQDAALSYTSCDLLLINCENKWIDCSQKLRGSFEEGLLLVLPDPDRGTQDSACVITHELLCQSKRSIISTLHTVYCKPPGVLETVTSSFHHTVNLVSWKCIHFLVIISFHINKIWCDRMKFNCDACVNITFTFLWLIVKYVVFNM